MEFDYDPYRKKFTKKAETIESDDDIIEDNYEWLTIKFWIKSINSEILLIYGWLNLIIEMAQSKIWI